jgi:hypothetical protein
MDISKNLNALLHVMKCVTLLEYVTRRTSNDLSRSLLFRRRYGDYNFVTLLRALLTMNFSTAVTFLCIASASAFAPATFTGSKVSFGCDFVKVCSLRESILDLNPGCGTRWRCQRIIASMCIALEHEVFLLVFS